MESDGTKKDGEQLYMLQDLLYENGERWHYKDGNKVDFTTILYC